MARIASILLILALTACSGSIPGTRGEAAAPLTGASLAISKTRGALTLRIRVPKRPVRRRIRVLKRGVPAYISASTKGMTIALSGPTAASETVGLSPGSQGCVDGTCTILIPGLLPCTTAGCYTATLKMYDDVICSPACSIPSTAQMLSAATSVAFTIVAGRSNDAAFTLEGIPVTLAIPTVATGYLQSSGTQLSLWGAQVQTLAVSALDADGNTIIGPGAPSVSGSTTSSALKVSQGTTAGTLSLRAMTTGSPPVVTPGSVALTVTATPQLTGAAPVSANLTVAIAHSAVYASIFNGNAVDIFLDGNSGLVPNQQIAGSNTLLDGPAGIAIGPDGSIYVASLTGNTVSRFAAGSNGNASPVSEISGASTALNNPIGLTFDAADGLIWVSDAVQNGPLLGFPYFESGNTTPLYSISGNATLLNNPFGLASDSQGRIYEANEQSTAQSILEFPATSTGNIAPLATLTTAHSGTVSPMDIDVPTGIALDSSDNVYVTNYYNSQALVLEFAAGSFGVVSPIREISETTAGASTTGIAIDASGDVWVADAASIKEFAPGAGGSATPLATIALPVNFIAVVPAAKP
jgi:sugar lactone lactonase YvrE